MPYTFRLFFFLIFLFYFFLITQNSNAQQFLALDKGGRIKRIHFYQGEMMHVKLKSTNAYMEGKLSLVQDTVLIGDEMIKLDDVDKVKVNSGGGTGTLLLSGAIILPAGAALFIFTGTINALINDNPTFITPGNAKLSAGLVLSGLLFWRLSYRVFKINKQHTLKVVDVSIQ